MHNRARLVTGSFLTKDLGIDWRARRRALLGPARRRRDREQRRQLAVGRRHRQRHAPEPRAEPDATGAAVRPARASTCAATCPSWRDVEGPAVHEPWKLDVSYPQPIVDHAQAAARFRGRRKQAALF